MQGRRIGPIVALLAAGALIGACGDDDDDTAADKPAAAKPATFAIEATAEGARKKAMTFPSTVRAGLVTMTLRNSDTVDRSAQIVRVTGDQTVEDVLKVVNAEETKIPSFMQDGGGIATAKPGATASATQVLAPGRYVIWDDLGGDEDDQPGNDELGAKGEFQVTGPAVDAELPAQPATVTATNDPDAPAAERYGFAFEGLKAGTNRVRFENTGTQLHHALFFPMRKGASLKEVIAAFASEEEPQGPPPVDFAKAVGTSVIDGGIAQNITLDLAAGRYAVVCFLSDRNGGKPHAAKGMIEQLTVE